jgi:hypothetical protein
MKALKRLMKFFDEMNYTKYNKIIYRFINSNIGLLNYNLSNLINIKIMLENKYYNFNNIINNLILIKDSLKNKYKSKLLLIISLMKNKQIEITKYNLKKLINEIEEFINNKTKIFLKKINSNDIILELYKINEL